MALNLLHSEENNKIKIEPNEPICRCCLSTEKEMRDVVPYEHYFMELAGISVMESYGLPQWLCWECAALLQKSVRFKLKMLQAHNLLYKSLSCGASFPVDAAEDPELKKYASPHLSLSKTQTYSIAGQGKMGFHEDLTHKSPSTTAQVHPASLPSYSQPLSLSEQLPGATLVKIEDDADVGRDDDLAEESRVLDRDLQHLLEEMRAIKTKQEPEPKKKKKEIKINEEIVEKNKPEEDQPESVEPSTSIMKINYMRQKEEANIANPVFPFVCLFCFERFNIKDKLENHMKKHSPFPVDAAGDPELASPHLSVSKTRTYSRAGQGKTGFHEDVTHKSPSTTAQVHPASLPSYSQPLSLSEQLPGATLVKIEDDADVGRDDDLAEESSFNMPQVYKRKTNRGLVSASLMLRAAREVKIYAKSIRSVAKEFGINARTLTRYCKKFTSEEISNTAISRPYTKIGYQRNRQIFTDEQEKELEKYLLLASSVYFGLSQKEVRKIAFQLAMSSNLKVPKAWESNKLAGFNWFTRFLKRHPALSIRTPETTSLASATSFNPHNVKSFFDNLESLIKRNNIQPHNIWNMDETEVTTVQKPSKVVTRKGFEQVGAVTSAERGTSVTLAAAVSAVGNSVPPFFVFQRVHFKDYFIRNGPIGCKGGSNPSGWMTEELFVAFLKHFHAHVKSTKENPCLLLIGNHSSHLSIEGLNFAKENGIVMLSFPPHCAHRLQPLDRSVYGPLKKHINTAMDQWMVNHPGQSMTIYDIPEIIAQAFPLAVSPSNIVTGFKVCGICPFNRDIFQDHDFMPSSFTDGLVTVPEDEIVPNDAVQQNNKSALNCDTTPQADDHN